MSANELLQLRQARLEAMRENKKFKDEWAENNEKTHKRNIEIKKERETIDMKIKTTMNLKKKRQEELRKKVSRTEVFYGIEEFEKKLEQLDKPANTNVSTISTSVPTTEKLEKEGLVPTENATLYLKKIKAKRLEEHAHRKEKEQRRRKVLMEQQQVFKDLEESRRREVLLEKLMKKSMEERQLAKELNEIKQLKQVMKENREIREKQYAERRRKDYEEKQKRESDLMEKEREERKLKKKELIEKHKILLEEKSKLKKEKHWNICHEVTNQIIDLAFKEIGYAETTEGERPTTSEMLQWRKMFVKGVFDENAEEDLIENNHHEMDHSSSIQRQSVDLDIIDLAEYKEYVLYKGIWREEYWNNNKIEHNEDTIVETSSRYLLSTVSHLHETIHPLPNPKSEPNIKSKHAFNVIIMGKPMSGKSSVCKKLASSLSLYHINPESILKKLFENQSPNHASEYSEILQRARSCLLEGREIDVSVIVEIVVNEIEKVEKNESPQYQGWIIEGFPTSVEAAKMLEKKISGYAPTLEEFLENDQEVRLNSIILNHNKSKVSDDDIMKKLIPFKAFTSVIFIDVDDDKVFERLADQKVDPVTGECYHMVFSPPDSLEITSRLIPIDEHTRLDKAQINSQLISFAKSKRDLLGWYKKFDNAFETSSDNVEELVAACTRIITATKRTEEPVGHTNMIEESHENLESLSVEKKSLDVEICKLFLNEWACIEQNYMTGSKMVFRNLREFRKSFFKQFSDLKDQFLNFLLKPDDKQVHISHFQSEFNKFPLELRSNMQVKDELHRRTDELKETLWTLCDEKKFEAEKELEDHQKESWLKTHKKAVTRQHMQLIQLELNRFIEQSKFLFDFYVEQYFSSDLNIGATLDPKKPILSAPLLSVNIEDLFVDVITSNSKTPSNGKKPPAKPSTTSTTRSKGDQADPQEASIDECFDRAKAASESLDLLAILQGYIDKNGKKKKEKSKDPYVDIPQDMREAIQKEQEFFVHRISVVKSRCNNSLKEQLDSKSEHIFDTMRDWIGQRYRTDMANVSLLARTVQEFIEKETPIVNEIRIEGNRCIIDESVQSTTPLPTTSSTRCATSSHESPESVLSFSKSFTPHQVFSLYERLQAPSPSGYVELEEITTTLLILIDSTFGSMELPNQWLEYDNEKVKEITRRFDPFKKGYINWRTFLLSALFTFFNRLPSIEDIRKLLMTVHPIISSGETDLKLEQFTDIMVKWISETSVSTNEEEVSKVLFNLFKPFINATVSNTVNIRTVLLYLCLDNQSVISTLTKGFEVLSYLNGTEGIDESGAYELLNFNLDIEEDVEDSFSINQIRAVFSEIKKSRESVSLEEFSAASIGKIILKQSVHLKLSSVFY